MARVSGNDTNYPASALDFDEAVALDNPVGENNGKRRTSKQVAIMPDITKGSMVFSGDSTLIPNTVTKSIIVNTGNPTDGDEIIATATTSSITSLGRGFDLTGTVGGVAIGSSVSTVPFPNGATAVGENVSVNSGNQTALGRGAAAKIPGEIVLSSEENLAARRSIILSSTAISTGSGTVIVNPFVLDGANTKGLYIGRLYGLIKQATSNQETLADYGVVRVRVTASNGTTIDGTTITPILITNTATKGAGSAIVDTDLNLTMSAATSGQLQVAVPQKTSGSRSAVFWFEGIITLAAG
jgi:hypothetical protein